MQVLQKRDDAGRVRVLLLDADGQPVAPVCRFLAHLADADYSPHTAAAYGYDLRLLFEFCAEQGLDWQEFRPSTALAFLGFLRRRPSRRPAQRLGLAVVAPGGRLLAPATVARALAATSSFYDWAISAEEFTDAENPLQRRPDPALARTSDRHRPATGRASRQAPIRRAVRVRLPQRLPRPLADGDVALLLADLTRLRDLALYLLMLDGGLRPGEALSLHLADVAYGRRRVVVRKRDDHPGGVRQKSRRERVVDLHDPRTLDTVSRYVLHERPADATSPFVFLVGGRGERAGQPLGYPALVRGFARRCDRLGIRAPDVTPHALRHTHATAMWEGGMRELALQARLGHASPESTRAYTRVSDERVLAEYVAALQGHR